MIYDLSPRLPFDVTFLRVNPEQSGLPSLVSKYAVSLHHKTNIFPTPTATF
jgi:hypothetical protein